MHANAWLPCLCLIGYVPSHLNFCMLCIALLVKRCSWLWRYGDDGSCLRKFPEILFKQYFGSCSAFTEHPPSFFCKIIFPFVVLNVACLFAFVMCLNSIFEFTGDDCDENHEIMLITLTSTTTMMRARMLCAVWPLLIWFWSAFSYGFCAILFSRVLLRLHWCVTWCMMNGYSVKAHGSVLMRVWASPYALQVLNYDAHVRSNCDANMHACYACACVSLVTSYRIRIYMWLHCSWSTARDCEDMVAMSDIDVDVKYLDAKVSWIFIVFMRMHWECVCVELAASYRIWILIFALLVKYRSWLWRYGCDVGHADWRETWHIFGCENIVKFYSNSISVHILQLLTIPPLFFTGSDDRTVRIWDVASQQQVAELKGHTSAVTSVAFDSSGKYLASGERRGAWAAARYDCTMNVMAFVARIAIGIWMVMVVGIGMTIAILRIIRIWNDDCCIAVMACSMTSMRLILHYNV